MSDRENKREQWIDIAKGIGILLVVLGHVTQNTNLIRIIYSFHMPLFFFLSGWLIDKSCGKKVVDLHYINKKIKQLILPFCEYRIILVAYWLLIERQFRDLDVGPIWFLPVMFITYIIVATTLPHLKNGKNKYLLLITFITLLYIGLSFRSIFYKLNNVFLNKLYITIVRSLAGCSWMVIGMTAKDTHTALRKINSSILFVCFAIMCISLSHINGDVSLFNLQFGKSYTIYYLEGISGIITLMICICTIQIARKVVEKLPDKKWKKILFAFMR